MFDSGNIIGRVPRSSNDHWRHSSMNHY